MATADDGMCPEFSSSALFTLTHYLKKPAAFATGFFLGAPAEIRTPDTLLKRQVLCLLSYWGIYYIRLIGWDGGTRTHYIRVKV